MQQTLLLVNRDTQNNFYVILDYVLERVDFENRDKSKNLKGEITINSKLGHEPEFRIVTLTT